MISPSVSWPLAPGPRKGPLHCQGTGAYPDAGAQRPPSLIRTPSRPFDLEGAPTWPSPGSQGAQGPLDRRGNPQCPRWTATPSELSRCLCTHHMAPSASAHWHARPLPRLLAPGELAASWPSAPFPPEWSREGGKHWGPAGAGAQASLGHGDRGAA